MDREEGGLTVTPEQKHVSDEFLRLRPKLKVTALRLTRNRDEAEDLLQDLYLKIIDKCHLYEPGTNFGAWAALVMRNDFVSRIRRRRETVDIADLPLAVPPRERGSARLFQLLRALPKENRLILLMSAIEGMSYEEITKRTGLELGTVKSRVSRTRDLLEGST